MAQPTKKKTTVPWRRWLLLVPIPLAWVLAGHFGVLDFFENRTIDWRFRYRGEMAAPVKIIYVDVDSKAIGAIGNMPWTRHFFADVTTTLLEHGKVRAIGFDFVFSPEGHPQSADTKLLTQGDVILGKQLFRFQGEPLPVVFGATFTANEFRAGEGEHLRRGLPLVATETRAVSEIEPPEQTGLATPRGDIFHPPLVGLIDTLHGGTRTVAAWTPTRTVEFRHMALELARLHWRVPLDGVKRYDDRIDFVRADGQIAGSVPLYDRQLVDVNWFSPWLSDHNVRYSFADIMLAKQQIESGDEAARKDALEFFDEAWRDAIVLIGPVDPMLQDLAVTPFDDIPVPKVGVHGNLVKTMVSGLYLRRPPAWAAHLITVLMSVLVAAVVVSGVKHRTLWRVAGGVLLVLYVGLVFHVFGTNHIILPATVVIGAVLSTSFGATVLQLIEEEKQKGRIKGMFGAYVSPDLVNRMVESGEDPQLGGHVSEITAYFSDIQGFSSFSEKLGSGPLVELMNEYLTACTDIVTAQGGTLDKYIGDAVVAMFGAPIALPDHAFRACVATQLVHRRLGELRDKWKSEGSKWPEIVWNMQSRIGLNSGEATIGNMGSRTRFNYTMMGDNVNLAARMESGAKSWGVYTMVSEATKLACETHGGDRVVFRALGKIVVMGRSQPVPIFEVVGLREFTDDPTRECIAIFEQALVRYYARDWKGAEALFHRSATLEPNQPGKTPGVKTNPSLVYLEHRLPEAITEPPPDNWDGRYVMKEK